jgi:hypothetical protein
LAEVVTRQRRHIHSPDVDPPGVGFDETVDAPQERRLARARGPDDAQELASWNLEVYRVERADAAREDLRQAFDPDQGRAGDATRSAAPA